MLEVASAIAKDEVKNRPVSSFWKVLWALLNNIGGMIAIFLFLNNYFGAALLVLAGAGIMVQGKFFNDFGWLSGMTAKVFGLTWFVAGSALVVINTI